MNDSLVCRPAPAEATSSWCFICGEGLIDVINPLRCTDCNVWFCSRDCIDAHRVEPEEGGKVAGLYFDYEADCPICHGSGSAGTNQDGSNVCERCDGRGVVDASDPKNLET